MEEVPLFIIFLLPIKFVSVMPQLFDHVLPSISTGHSLIQCHRFLLFTGHIQVHGFPFTIIPFYTQGVIA